MAFNHGHRCSSEHPGVIHSFELLQRKKLVSGTKARGFVFLLELKRFSKYEIQDCCRKILHAPENTPEVRLILRALSPDTTYDVAQKDI